MGVINAHNRGRIVTMFDVYRNSIMSINVYNLLAMFLIYSFLGWLVESIYMSICNRRVTNRGFAKGPFCPIYGFGATLGYFIVAPLADNVVLLYFVSAIGATAFEYLVGIGMKRFLGEVWWDYNNKFLNYKGIICLESTVAWGFYGIIVVRHLTPFLMRIVERPWSVYEKRLLAVMYALLFIDYVFSLSKALHLDTKYNVKQRIQDKYEEIKERWY